MMRCMLAVAAFSVVSLTACIPYPIYKTLQPASHVEVRGDENRPLAGAVVTLISNAYPYGDEKARYSIETSHEGLAVFPSVKEWRTEAIMLHGEEVFFWNWCVRKDGYKTFHTTHRYADVFEREIIVRLMPGASAPCPERFH